MIQQAQIAVQILFDGFQQADREKEFLDEVPDNIYYEGLCSVVIRVLFVFYAQERGLLPIENAYYQKHFGIQEVSKQKNIWKRLCCLFRVLYLGFSNAELTIPSYGGDYFDPLGYPFLEGEYVFPNITDECVLGVLDCLWVSVRGVCFKAF